MKTGNRRFVIFLIFLIIPSVLFSCKGSEITENNTSQYTFVCFFSIECSAAFSEKSDLDPSLATFLPSDGFILTEREVGFNEGESVADVLRRVCNENGIPLETTSAPIYGGIYVEGIGNLYEFDCGSGSGWMYSVNGEFPNYGASSYMLTQGDRVEWKYTCDFGEDINGKKMS